MALLEKLDYLAVPLIFFGTAGQFAKELDDHVKAGLLVSQS
jgi:hypothetical protein